MIEVLFEIPFTSYYTYTTNLNFKYHFVISYYKSVLGMLTIPLVIKSFFISPTSFAIKPKKYSIIQLVPFMQESSYYTDKDR